MAGKKSKEPAQEPGKIPSSGSSSGQGREPMVSQKAKQKKKTSRGK